MKRPSWPAELAKAFFYIVGVLSTGAVLLIVLGGSRGGGFDPIVYVCTMFSAAVWAAFVGYLFIVLRTLIRMLRRDPRVGTRFFPAADAEPGWRVDPVKSVDVGREPMQVTLKRPHALRITTHRGLQFRLLRGRPPEELEALASELRSLLRLDSAPAKGFPVVPVEAKM
jgi:hypothetical protein